MRAFDGTLAKSALSSLPTMDAGAPIALTHRPTVRLSDRLTDRPATVFAETAHRSDLTDRDQSESVGRWPSRCPVRERDGSGQTWATAVVRSHGALCDDAGEGSGIYTSPGLSL